MSKIDAALKEDFRRSRNAVERYGIRVYIGDVIDPNTGIFDGSEIGIDYANDLDASLFVLVHLFGHTVQWNTVPAYRTIDQRAKAFAPAEVIEEARVYEENASRLGMQLFHEAGIHHRDQWISDYRASDWKYLSTYYTTGTLPAWKDCVMTGQPMLTPMAIPPFSPQRFPTRYAF